MQAKKGFTLIELLVVLAIVAILSVVVILTLNPAELLKQARDSNRLSDLGTMKSAISLYLADVSTVNMGSLGNKCYPSLVTTTMANNCAGFFTSNYVTNTTSTAGNLRLVNGSGWLPIDLTVISSGAPLGNLPIDPVNSNALFYAYAATSTNNGFKLTAVLESTKYTVTTNMMSSDGGISTSSYESGTNLTL